MTLDDLGLKHKTDKASSTHGYLKTYEKYLGHLQDKEITLLEVGVASGASIRLWREYFPNAKIFGIDNNPDCAGEGIFIGNATDEVFMESVLAEIGSPDIVIEDSGHVGDETVKIFEIMFKRIRSGGMMFVEDCATFYNNHYSGEFQSNGRTRVYNFFSDLAYHVDVAGRGMNGNQDFAIEYPTDNPPVPSYSRLLKAMHIHTSLWVFERK